MSRPIEYLVVTMIRGQAWCISACVSRAHADASELHSHDTWPDCETLVVSIDELVNDHNRVIDELDAIYRL